MVLVCGTEAGTGGAGAKSHTRIGASLQTRASEHRRALGALRGGVPGSRRLSPAQLAAPCPPRVAIGAGDTSGLGWGAAHVGPEKPRQWRPSTPTRHGTAGSKPAHSRFARWGGYTPVHPSVPTRSPTNASTVSKKWGIRKEEPCILGWGDPSYSRSLRGAARDG